MIGIRQAKIYLSMAQTKSAPQNRHQQDNPPEQALSKAAWRGRRIPRRVSSCIVGVRIVLRVFGFPDRWFHRYFSILL